MPRFPTLLVSTASMPFPLFPLRLMSTEPMVQLSEVLTIRISGNPFLFWTDSRGESSPAQRLSALPPVFSPHSTVTESPPRESSPAASIADRVVCRGRRGACRCWRPCRCQDALKVGVNAVRQARAVLDEAPDLAEQVESRAVSLAPAVRFLQPGICAFPAQLDSPGHVLVSGREC